MNRLLCPLFVIVAFSARCQPKATSIIDLVEYPRLDTLKFYAVTLRKEIIGRKTYYQVDDCPVDKEVYDYYYQFDGNSEKCRPCYRKTYDMQEKLISEGPEYAGCQVGKWIEYYPDGKLKMTGHYRVNDTGNWDEPWRNGYCSVEEGIWIYYDENGNVTKVERYVDGEIVK